MIVVRFALLVACCFLLFIVCGPLFVFVRLLVVGCWVLVAVVCLCMNV